MIKRRAETTVYRVAAVRDAHGCDARPGVVAVSQGRVAYAGTEREMPRSLRRAMRASQQPPPKRNKAQPVRVIDRSNDLLLPALVNAHAHLDLTDIGPQAFDPKRDEFVDWLRQVIAARPKEPEDITAAVHRGLALSRDAGVGWIGDVAGSVAAIRARRQAPVELRRPGVSYLECFGLGERARAAAREIERTLEPLDFEVEVQGWPRGAVIGLAPHAPYAVGRPLYEELAKLGQRRIYRLTTHLAESHEELRFVRDADGPFEQLLRELGKWDPAVRPTGEHPVKWIEPALRRGRWLLAHCNYVEDEHIRILDRTGASVAYCPIASDYFGQPRDGRHRYQRMLDAGVNVCLGTDSILCQPEDAKQPLGILPQMRYLYARDRTAPERLLAMGTTNGMQALELRDLDATFREGTPAVFTAVRINPDDPTDPLIQALTSDAPAELVDLS